VNILTMIGVGLRGTGSYRNRGLKYTLVDIVSGRVKKSS
jgi:hypothetical protein